MVDWKCLNCKQFVQRSENIPFECPHCGGSAFYAVAEQDGDGGSFAEPGDMLIGFVDVV